MFCSKCGKQLPDGVTVCDCEKEEAVAVETTVAEESANVENGDPNVSVEAKNDLPIAEESSPEADAAIPATQASASQEATADASALTINTGTLQVPLKENGRAFGAWTYFMKHATPGFKILNYVSMAFGAFCIIFILLASFKFVNGSIFKTPLFKLISVGQGDVIEENLDKIRDGLEDYVENGKSASWLEQKYDIDLEELEESGINAEELLDLISPLSLKSILKVPALLGLNDSESLEIINVLDAVLDCVIIIGIAFAALLALGIVFKKTGLVVLTYIISLAYFAIIGGISTCVLSTIFFITLAVLVSKLKKEYKYYRRNVRQLKK